MKSLCSSLAIILAALIVAGNGDPAQAGIGETGFVQWFETPSGDLLICESFGPTQKGGPAPRCAAYYAFAGSGKELRLFDYAGMNVFPSEAQPPLISDGNGQVVSVVCRESAAFSPENGADARLKYEFFFEVDRVAEGKATQLFRTPLDTGEGWWPVFPVRHFPQFRTWVCLARGSERAIAPSAHQLQHKILYISDAGEVSCASPFVMPRNAAFVGSMQEGEGSIFALIFVDRGTPPWALNLDSDGHVYGAIWDLASPDNRPVIQRITDVRGGETSSCCVSPSGSYMCTLNGSSETRVLAASIWELRKGQIAVVQKTRALPGVSWVPTSPDTRYIVKWAAGGDTEQLLVAIDTAQDVQMTLFDTNLGVRGTRSIAKPLPGYNASTFVGSFSYLPNMDRIVYTCPRQTHVFRHDFKTGNTGAVHCIRYQVAEAD